MFPRRIVGFMELARQIINKTPGLTAQEVYRRADEIARQEGRKLSAAKSPQGSLVATLHKHHAQYGLRREKDGRGYRYYPANLSFETPPSATIGPVATSNGCCLALPPELDKQLDALISLGRFNDRHEAQQALIAMGLQTMVAKLTS